MRTLALAAILMLTACGVTAPTPTAAPSPLPASPVPTASQTSPTGAPSSSPSSVPGRIIVGYQSGVSTAERDAVRQGARTRGAVPGTVIAPVGPDAELIDVGGTASLTVVIDAYRADARVRYAEPDTIVRATG